MPRKNTDFNGYELLFLILLMFRGIENQEQLFDYLQTLDKEKRIFVENSDEYIKDIKSRKKNQINNFINNVRIYYQELPELSDIEKVILTGKSIKNYPEIVELNKDLPKSERTKADIFINLKNGKWIGYSIKQSKKATKMNRSVQDCLPKEESKRLTEIKKDYICQECGIDITNKDMAKANQKKINKSLYPDENKGNPYWDNLKKCIENNLQHVKDDLLSTLCGKKLKYDLYEFDGKDLGSISKPENIDNIVFKEHKPFYYTKRGSLRKAAKLFYLFKNGKNEYRVEIRHKGSFTASPQFQFHQIK